jgi:hypothetical protein
MRAATTVTACLAAVLVIQGAGDFAAGERAYRDGRFADAAAAFAQEIGARGDAAPAELHYDLALAALAAGDLQQAQDAVAQAARSDDAELQRRCAFVQGHVAWQRGEAAAKLALQVEAEPFAFKPALEQIALAGAEWRAAATGAGDWAAARRNAERAVRRFAELQQQKQRIEDERKRRTGAQARPMAVPGGSDDKRGAGSGGDVQDAQDNPLAPLRTELSDAQVAELFARLLQKDEQARQLRRSQQQAARSAVERDW